MTEVSSRSPLLSLADLITADRLFYDALTDIDDLDLDHEDGSPAHTLIMNRRCKTLPDVRAKLAWMTEGGTCLRGSSDAFKLLLSDMDRIIGEKS